MQTQIDRISPDQMAACHTIAEHYGQKKQEIQAVQELSELICVLARRPDQRGKDHTEQLLDEIADSLIMIEQIRMLHLISVPEVEKRIDYKLQRQLDRIKKEGDHEH